MIEDSDILVSVQSAGSASLAEGHLSWGVLWNADAILVPDPTGWVEDTKRFEVVVARSGCGRRSLVRISPLKISLLGSPDQPGSTVGLIFLAAPVCEPPVRSMCSDTFMARFEKSGDAWDALECQNTIPTGLRSRGLENLEMMGEIEAELRSQLVQDFRHPGSNDVRAICRWTPLC